VIHNLAHKREAVEWAAELLADPGGFIVLDTETTGLGPHDQIVQIAIIWQRLPGGDHSALGDARATLNLVRRMAGGDA
jgi:DNA polymerase III epsilon subunit-like protein